MIFRALLALCILLTACSHRLPRKHVETTYRLISEPSDDLRKPEKAAIRSKAELEIDFETGSFKGRYRNHDFKGNYLIEHVSAGFVKGFFYRVRMGDLHRPESQNVEEEAFFESLSGAKRLYVAPDKLAEPAYTLLEISGAEPAKKLILVKINR